MSRTHKGKESSRSLSNDGTSARTRPLSYEEIILRRKKKLAAGAEERSMDSRKPSEAKDGRGFDDSLILDKSNKKVADLKEKVKEKSRRTEEPERQLTPNIKDNKVDNLKENIKERSRRTKEPERGGSSRQLIPEMEDKKVEYWKEKSKERVERLRRIEEPERSYSRQDKKVDDFKEKVKERSRRIEEPERGSSKQPMFNVKFKKVDVLKDKVKEGYRKMEELARNKYDGEGKNVAGKSKSSKSSRDKESNREKQTHDKGRVVDQSGSHLGAKSEKSYVRNVPEKEDRDRHEGRDGRSKREKRTHYSHEDEKTKTEVKQEYGKSKYKDYAERYDRKKDSSPTESRSRRRRSRSRDYDQERDRSLSMSPRAKRPHHDRGHMDSLLEKSRWKLDDEASNLTSNGAQSRGIHRKHGSGLGGYSPRKRRTEAAARTPSPVSRSSPEKKAATWDQPPEKDHFGSGSLLSDFGSPLTKSKELLTFIPISSASTKTQTANSTDVTSLVMKASIDSIQLTEGTRPMRRLYVENLPLSASEKSVTDYFNDFLLSSGTNHIQGTKPCISCIINKDKSQALAEFLTPEDATAALSFDGKYMSGSILKIRRPKDFVETTAGDADKPKVVIEAISDAVKDSPHKIFIAGISNVLSSDLLLEIVGAFGQVRAFRFEYNEEIKQSCAFLEYVDHSVTLKACAGLNGMKLGGRILTAVQAIPDAQVEEEDEKHAPSYDIPIHAKPLLVEPTEVLQIKNVFTQEDLLMLSAPEIDETLEDIRLESARFGTVKSQNLVRSKKIPDTVQQAVTSTTVSDYPIKEGGVDDMLKDDLGKVKNDDVPVNVKESQDTTKVSLDTRSIDELSTNDSEGRALAESNPDNAAHRDLHHFDEGVQTNEVDSSDEKTPLNTTLSASMVVESTDVKKPSIEDTNMNGSSNGKSIGLRKPISGDLSADIAKPDTGNVEGGHRAVELDVFEEGCVLVEFSRKEAACSAAHCLHMRLFDERVVSVSYVRRDLYLSCFPR